MYQLKITLTGSMPPIWRRIQVPESCSFWDLHVAIQNSMGWSDSHLHLFKVVAPVTGRCIKIGIPERVYGEVGRTRPGWRYQLADYISMERRSFVYLYDFGDNWKHAIELEKILPRDGSIACPICIDGKRACPPDDCGGIHGYMEFLEAMADRKHPRHREKKAWIGGSFDPKAFSAKHVVFEDPEARWRKVMGDDDDDPMPDPQKGRSDEDMTD